MASYEADTKAKPPSDDVAKSLLWPLKNTYQNTIASSDVKYSYEKQHTKICAKETCYPMTHRPRGRGLVVTMTENRAGWDRDVKAILIMFEYLNVHGTFLYDLTGKELITQLESFASSKENENVDCLFVVLMGHGGIFEDVNKEFLKTADNKAFFVGDGFKHSFNNNKNRHLIDIPKIFIVQMCRGGSAPMSVLLKTEKDFTNQDTLSCGTSSNVTADAEPIPVTKFRGQFSDYIFCFSTQSGLVSLRHTSRGALYIQVLTEVFMKQAADRPVAEMLAEVNERLEGHSDTIGKETPTLMTQVGESVSTLKKALYLFPGLQKIDKPPMILEMTQRDPVLELSAAANPEVQSAWRVSGLSNWGALITYGCEPVFKVMQVGSKGNREGQDFDDAKSGVNAVVVQRSRALFLESKGRISSHYLGKLNCKEDSQTWEVENVRSLWDAACLSEDELVVVDSLKGEVFTYNLHDKTKVVQVNGLDFPASVACFRIGKETKIAIVEQGKHRVLFYDGEWKKQPYIIGKKEESDGQVVNIHSNVLMKCPIYCQFLTSGNLLVCDRDSHRVTEFTSKAEFVRDWLTEEDSIKHPMSISFVMPYLWVVHAPGQKNVSRFEIYWFDG